MNTDVFIELIDQNGYVIFIDDAESFNLNTYVDDKIADTGFNWYFSHWNFFKKTNEN